MRDQRRRRRRDGGLLRPLRLVVLLGVAAALLYAPSAWATATTYTVDNTTDATGQACTASPTDCSLRSAIANSNSNSGVDTINFDPAVFTGLDLTSTITSSSATAMVISDGVNINGGNCGTPTVPKPCVELDTNATIGLEIFTTGAISISGMSFVGSPGSAISVSGGLPGPTVTGSWFGVGLDGTTLKGNADGITMNNTTTGGVIGGSTPATRNVFSSDGIGVNIAGNGAHAIRGNYFGTLPDATAVSNPGTTAINISGGGSGITIGGDSDHAGQCDGQCNLIVGFSGDGIFAQDAGGAPSNLTISGNFIGLGLNGTSNKGNGTGVNKGSGIELAGSGNHLSNVTIGGAANTKRNYIAGNTDGGIKAALTDTLNVTNNYIGLNAAGTSSIANTFASATGSGGLTDLAGTGGTIADNRFGGNGVLVYKQMTVQGNVIGVGPSGQDLGITAAEPGLTLLNDNNSIGDFDNSTTAHANTIGNVKGTGQPGILLTGGASSNTIAGNYVGTTSTGTPEPIADDGISLGGNNVMIGNSVGGSATENANVISNSGGDAISLKVGSNGGAGNHFGINLGKNNGTGPNDIFIDLGDFSTSDGPGNPGGNAPNNGIQAPTVNATTGTISGTALPMASIFIYTTYSSQDDVRASLGSTQADGSGNWSIATPSDLFPGQCVTANQTDGNNNTSEMAIAAGINTGSQCFTYPAVSINGAPSDGASINDTTPQIVFSSPNDPVTFTCELNGTPIDPCTSPLDLGPLTDDDYTFTLRSAQTPSNPALGPDTSDTVTTHFTVDTMPPTVSFTSGPAEGSSTTDTSVSVGFSADESAAFECKVDSGAFHDCSSPLSLSGLAAGSHAVQVRGTDDAGNTSAVVTRHFTVTSPPPPPSSSGPTGQRAAALKKCKKKKSAKARTKCKAKAKKLPV